MSVIDHLLGIGGMLCCAGIVVAALMYACIVAGKRADERLHKHWDGRKMNEE